MNYGQLETEAWSRGLQCVFFNIGHSFYAGSILTPAKTRYPLTSITWLLRA